MNANTNDRFADVSKTINKNRFFATIGMIERGIDIFQCVDDDVNNDEVLSNAVFIDNLTNSFNLDKIRALRVEG